MTLIRSVTIASQKQKTILSSLTTHPWWAELGGILTGVSTLIDAIILLRLHCDIEGERRE